MKIRIENLIDLANRTFGKGTVLRGGEKAPITRIPTGVFALDFITLGGIPAGKVTLIRGKEKSTKTITAMLCARNYQDLCSKCWQKKCLCKKPRKEMIAYIDVEGKFPQAVSDAAGIARDRLLLLKPECAEHAADLTDQFLRCGDVGFVVFDSIAALCPLVEIQTSAEKELRGVIPREVNRLLRKVIAAFQTRAKEGTPPTLVIINQERIAQNVSWADPTITPGGEGQKYISSLIIKQWQTKREEKLKEGELPRQANIKAVVMAHSFGPDRIDCEYTLLFRDENGPCLREVAWEGRLLRFAQTVGLIQGNGQTIKVEGVGAFQDYPAATRALEHDPKMALALRKRVIEQRYGPNL